MPDFDLNWNGDKLVAALSEPFHQANEQLGVVFAQEISENKWDWPTGDSPRDIVDDGDLRGSYKGERASPTDHDHSWNIEYAMAVHEGYATRSGSRMPGRPWTKEPLENGTLEKAFEKLVRVELGKIR